MPEVACNLLQVDLAIASHAFMPSPKRAMRSRWRPDRHNDCPGTGLPQHSRDAYIRLMRRLRHLLLAVLAFAGVSMDTSGKLFHGVAHQRETLEALHHAHGSAVSPGGGDRDRGQSLEASDAEVEHDALHASAASIFFLKAPPALAKTANVPSATVVQFAVVAVDFVAHAQRPPGRSRTIQPRAPPLG